MSNFVMFIKKHRVAIIVLIVIWILAEVFLVSPIAYSIASRNLANNNLIEDFVKNIASMNCFGKVFNSLVIGHFLKTTLFFTIFYIGCIGIGIYKGRSKGDYDKIEHGSSDWSESGEQYRVLSKNTGLILAEKNYLPLNKVGNVNVLIVGGSGS